MKRILLAVFAILSLNVWGNTSTEISLGSSQVKTITVNVTNQKEFDAMEANIASAVKSGAQSVNVMIGKGVYFFSNTHLQLKSLNDKVDLSIVGKDAILIGKGKTFNPNSVIDRKLAFSQPGSYSPLDLWSEVRETECPVEVLDAAKKNCRIKVTDARGITTNSMIQISQWYYTRLYYVTSVSGNWVYFTDSKLDYSSSYKGYSINYDQLYGHQNTRYRVWRGQSSATVFGSEAISFINADDLKAKTIKISGLTFMNSAISDILSLIKFNNVKSQGITVEDCSFTNVGACVLKCARTENVVCRNCQFSKNRTTCIYFDNYCKNMTVDRCSFVDNSTGWNNTFCINTKAQDFVISNNYIQDFCYGGIGVGVWYAEKKNNPVTGVIEQNEICYSRKYYADYKRHTLMDAGAIYTWTQNDNVAIRYNYIHDYIGMKDNRGIFCDDGTSNVKMYGNVITRIANSYAIDLRSCPSIEQKSNSKTSRVNVNNLISGNVFDGDLRFQGRSGGANGCKKEPNYLLVRKGEESPSFKVSNVGNSDPDVTIQCKKIGSSKTTISRSSYKSLKKNPYWSKVKGCFRKAWF